MQTYELIDLDSGNVVGDFDSAHSALHAVRRIIADHGTGAIVDCALFVIRDDQQSLVAMEAALVDWALADPATGDEHRPPANGDPLPHRIAGRATHGAAQP